MPSYIVLETIIIPLIVKNIISTVYFSTDCKENCYQEIESQAESEKILQARLLSEDFGSSSLGRLRSFLWNTTEYPEASLAARVG